MKRTLLLLSALSFGAMSAFALDGQILINQSTLTAGGGTYVISQPGSYKLTGNLTTANSDNVTAITITASIVTLDLNWARW